MRTSKHYVYLFQNSANDMCCIGVKSCTGTVWSEKYTGSSGHLAKKEQYLRKPKRKYSKEHSNPDIWTKKQYKGKSKQVEPLKGCIFGRVD